MSGKKLKPEKVKHAREEEMIEVRKHKVYVKVPVSNAGRKQVKHPLAPDGLT